MIVYLLDHIYLSQQQYFQNCDMVRAGSPYRQNRQMSRAPRPRGDPRAPAGAPLGPSLNLYVVGKITKIVKKGKI